MSRHWRTAALVSVVTVGLCASGSRPAADWSALLEAFARHDERGKALVQNAAGSEQESPERKLARMLLDDWGPPIRPERLQHAQIVLLPSVAPSTRNVTMEVFDLNVRIGPDGRVVAVALLKPPRQSWLSRVVLAKVRAALFRPAFRDGRFVESEAVVEYTVHVK